MSWWQRCKTRFWACFGYESEFEALPLGASVDATYRNHVGNGDAARMILYHYDFVDGAASLNLHGQDQLTKIAAMLTQNGFPVVIERTPSTPALAEQRRLVVLYQLGMRGITIPAGRVVIGKQIANGLRGSEAEIIHENLLSQTHARGVVPGVATSGVVGSPASAGGGTGGGVGTPSLPQ
jgi:hypothetical protein